MPYQTYGLRHDTDHLFALLLRDDKWLMTPCVVIDGKDIIICRNPHVLLTLGDDFQVICGWPGKQRQDVFEFTVGQFRAAVQARDHIPQEGTMTCVDEKRDEEPKPECQEKAAEPAAEGDAAAEAKPEGECAASSEACGHAPAAQPTEQAAE